VASDGDLAPHDLPRLEVVPLEVRRDAVEAGRVEAGGSWLQIHGAQSQHESRQPHEPHLK
jgi:hypothetical protein